MKNEILERAMFAMPLSKDARNSGIMAGFEEDMPEDMEDEGMEEMPPMARTPQNPEILMNTLRGDMRSLDARYQELAQMVGEDAAMETPPEVLAMLQPQLAAPPAGIGGLPQAQGMMPPGMGMPPDQMGAPQPAPAMPQGGIPMPAGMESAPPFSPGAEEAPPTPDGMPPIRANVGMFITPFTRAAQFMGDKAAQYGPAVNQYMGNLMMRAQPTVQRVTGGSPPMPLSVQGRETLVQGPAGTIVQGAGTQLAPYTTMGPLMSPTFTEGLKMGVQRTAQEYPRIAEALSRMSPALALGTGALSALPFTKDSNTPMSPEQRASYDDKMAQLAAIDQIPSPSRTQQTPPPVAPATATTAAEQAAIDERQVAASDKASADPLGLFINQKLKAFDERAAKGKPLSKMERIKASQAEYAPLFEELLGSDKESAKINALLLLSEAGLKLAGSTKPTVAMSVSDAFAGVPRGIAAIAAQERELGIKTKSAALQQAISDVSSEDAAAAARQKLVLEYTMKAELEKAKQGGGNVIYENAGAGGLIGKDKAGNYKGFFINPESPDYKEIAENPILVNNFTSTNPFAKDLGKATTVTAQSLKKREEIQEKMNLLTGLIAKVDTGLSQVTNAFSPGTFVNNLANNVVVPLVPNFILRPDVDQAATIAILNNVFSDITRGNAEVGGKLSVQGEKWARENAKAIKEPAGLLKNPELAAKVFGTIKTGYLNEYAQLASQLGIGTRNIVVTTPPTGTKNDPFVIPSDAAGQQQMLNYLRINFGAVDDPKASVYVRNPDGIVRSTPVQNLFKPVGQ
jgi:hypothetical protein